MTPNPDGNYNFKATEQKWQQQWEAQNVFQPEDGTSKKQKYYVLEMFPYPSGRIHMGHLRNYTIGDVVARYKKACNYNVLHPMGWDSFGLPAENAAIENNSHPNQWTNENIDYMRTQLKSIGFSYDWSRELTTCSPEYYQHEQAIFIDFYTNNLAYKKESLVNWDPVDNTVLANEQVVDGKGWRSGAPIERRKLNQWFLRISNFAEELLQSLDTLENWPEKVRTMQKRWIGKSTGLRILFNIKNSPNKLDVYTTRPDTIFGASFCAIAPNHPLATEIAQNNPEAQQFITKCNKLGMAEETIEKTEKQGYNTNIKILHPFDPSIEIPLFIANFVLMEYGTGAIFGCPAHDQRDLDFAIKYNLPITTVISPEGDPAFTIETEAYTGDGLLINSSFLNNKTVDDAKQTIIQKIEQANQGKATTNYRIRDWGISRQRYWGCPIPIIHCQKCGTIPVPKDQLPVTLPTDINFDQPGNPLDRHPTWKHTTCPTCNGNATRETDTFDTFFESSWYFIGFCSKQINNGINKKACNHWLPVDQYIGGIEHAVLHLLYARFFTLALKECGYIDIAEPFNGLLTQGMVCHETYQDQDNNWLFPEEIIKHKNQYTHHITGQAIKVGRSQKMSKSKKNVVDPSTIIEQYGADTARLFMLSDSPPERDLEWSNSGIEGAWKYINRLWKTTIKLKQDIANIDLSSTHAIDDPKHIKIQKLIHQTVNNVTDDIEKFRLNKAVARIRELTNSLNEIENNTEPPILQLRKEGLETAIILLQPIIPHLSEELWHQLGNKGLVVNTTWPTANKKFLVDNNVTIAVQLNGKLKATIELPKDSAEEDVKKIAIEHSKMQDALTGKEIRKIIVVPNRIVNVVA